MNELFAMDKKNYDPSWPTFTRNSARAIIVRDDKVLMMYSQKYSYYKFPGGGIDKGETPEQALVREVLEESGRVVIPDSIREYGYVPRRQKDALTDGIFAQDNYYYFCEVTDDIMPQKLDDYEHEEGFTPVWIEPMDAYAFNRHNPHGDTDPVMIKRDSRVLNMIDLYLRKQRHAREEEAWINSLGDPIFADMIKFVDNYLGSSSGWVESKLSIRYSRFRHTKRVLGWAVRLYNLSPIKDKIDYNTIITATIFHDVGYNDATEKLSHAEAGATVACKYLEDNGFDEEFIENVCDIIRKHSDKWLMQNPDIAPDLLLVMEADLLDDMGALGITMDCMIERALDDHATFEDALDHIGRYTLRQQKTNPMRTPEGKKIWDEKTELTEKFYNALETDIMGWR